MTIAQLARVPGPALPRFVHYPASPAAGRHVPKRAVTDLRRRAAVDQAGWTAREGPRLQREGLHILLDRARRRLAGKRGGDAQRVNLDAAPEVGGSRARELVALDDALNELAKVDGRKAKVVEMRFFGGLSVEETAATLGVSEDTVMRDWRLAKAWLSSELKGSNAR